MTTFANAARGATCLWRLPLALTVLLLAGCADSDVKEVEDWMAQVKREAKVSVTPLSEPKAFFPFAYAEQGVIDPFSADKLLAELARAAAAQNADRLKPDMARRKEFLENFPLDTMTMVGVMQKGGINYALVNIDKTVHQIRLGQRLGQNYGLVTTVAEDAVLVKEVVQDAGGEWVERPSKLELQESKGTQK